MTKFIQVGPAAVPAQFVDRMCRCGQRESFTAHDIGNGIIWYVCAACRKPAPLNAKNARLYRECEMCESWYWVYTWPDRNDICDRCA